MNASQDRDLESSVAKWLRMGLIASVATLLFGAFQLYKAPVATPSLTHYSPGSPALSTMGGIMQGTIDLAPESILQLGVLLLLLTPMLRVLVCLAGFLKERDWQFVVISFLVFSALIFSLLHV